MRDIDELLDAEKARARAATITPPPFEVLRARGLRRRRQRTGAATAGVVLVVAAALTVGQLLGSSAPQSGEPAPAPAPTPVLPTPVPTQSTLSPDSLVDGSDAVLREVVVDPGDPRVRVALWERCPRKTCSGEEFALAVTGDGFATRSAVTVPGDAYPRVTSISGSAFHVIWGDESQVVLGVDGTTTPVELRDGSGPLAEDEVLVATGVGTSSTFIAVDPETGTAHPVPVPAGVAEVVAQPDGTLHGMKPGVGSSATVWSNDRGATWEKRMLSSSKMGAWRLLPSSSPGVLAVVEGADGATFFPLRVMHRSIDGGVTWKSTHVRSDREPYLGAGGVLPDGRLLVEVNGWSDDEIGAPSAHPRGLHVSRGSEWSFLEAVPGGAPIQDSPDSLTSDRRVSMLATSEGLVLVALNGLQSDQVGISTDGGATWSQEAAR